MPNWTSAVEAIKKGASQLSSNLTSLSSCSIPWKKHLISAGRMKIGTNLKYLLEDTVKKKTRELSDALQRGRSIQQVKDAGKEMILRADGRCSRTGMRIQHPMHSQENWVICEKNLRQALRMPTSFIKSITYASANVLPGQNIWAH